MTGPVLGNAIAWLTRVGTRVRLRLSVEAVDFRERKPAWIPGHQTSLAKNISYRLDVASAAADAYHAGGDESFFGVSCERPIPCRFSQ